jgi:protein-S-isoprenylcysteine O-methyltransferase Ste14
MSAPALTTENRQQWLLRAIPATLLTTLYGGIALKKATTMATELAAVAGDDWARPLLLALHSASGAIFFGIIAAITIVRKEPLRRERRLIGWLLPFAVTLALAVVGWYDPRDYPTPVLLLGTAFVVAGTGFTIYALRHLGRHFGVVSDVRGLVTTGPYRYVRHPLYAGETLTTIGFVIAVASPLTIAAFALGIALQIWRAKVEEQALTAAFPEYQQYARRTPMLIPLVRVG